MLFALSVLLLVCVPSFSGNNVTERNIELNNTHFSSLSNRSSPQRNQTKITRDDQLLSLLAARRRQIIQNRFKSHLQNIVDITNGSANISVPLKNVSLPNNAKILNVHLNLSDLLKNPVSGNSEESVNLNNTSTESNLVNVSSPRTINKPNNRKNGDASQIPENKNLSKQTNAPIIRNILYRRKMSYLNRKLPLDIEQIAFDTLGLSEINKNPEDLIFDNEDSLQVEESSHDKLIYYDVKNNASKKSSNNFEDTSDEIKTMTMHNKTFQNNKKNLNMSTTELTPTELKNKTVTSVNSNLDDIVLILNNTESTTNETVKQNKTEIKLLPKNNTRFMSQSLYNYFRPLDIPEEEMQPFLHFGDKITATKQNQSTKATTVEKRKPIREETTSSGKNEEEINENMDVMAEKPVLFENKIAKMNLPNPKVVATRDYYKNRNQSKVNSKNLTETANKTISPVRISPRNRSFRNQTIFFQNKRSGIRQTINLRGNASIADLRPSTVSTESVVLSTTTTTTPHNNGTDVVTFLPLTEKTPLLQNIKLNTTDNKQIIKMQQNTTETVTPTQSPETSTLVILTSTKAKVDKLPANNSIYTTQKMNTFNTSTTETDLLSSSTRYTVPDSTTSSVPTTRILSTAVVTSVSIESSKSKANKTDDLQKDKNKNESVHTTTDLNDSEATVVAALSNFTIQAFQNKTRANNTSTRNPATVYPNIKLDIPLADLTYYSQHFDYPPRYASNSTVTQQTNKTKFILRPNRTSSTTAQPVFQKDTSSSSDFIIHVADVETLPTESINDVTTIKIDTSKAEVTSDDDVKIQITSRFNFDMANEDNGTVVKDTNLTNLGTNETIGTTTEEESVGTRSPTIRTFNTTVYTKPDTDSELPLATLFSVTDFKKMEGSQNGTKPKIPSIETVISRKNENEISIENIHAAYILAALGFLPMIVIVIYVVRSVMKKKNKIVDDFEAEMHQDSEKKSIIHPVARLPTLVLDPSNKWEFPRSKLRLQTLLGQGNFGQVWKAEADDLKGHVGLTRLVAVKTIKDGAGSKERDDLLKELAIMQKMGSHPNVVTLLGCCTDKEPYLLIMEYVMYGKLLTYLRDHRTRRDYYNFSDDAATLTARDLTVFAYCVTRGMEYLSSKGIIHRDLAARNILVDHNKLCKIADFGMSRDVGPSGEITEPRQPRNALPVRWMAIESLLYSVFSSKTDVWAFGVLLWEIVTLGSSPYANMSGREVMRLVCEGYRLERPSHCRPELYRVMARAWNTDPGQRPTFAELRADLAAMLDTTPAEGSYVDLESFRADSTVYEIDNCTPRGNYFTVKSRFSEFECDI